MQLGTSLATGALGWALVGLAVLVAPAGAAHVTGLTAGSPAPAFSLPALSGVVSSDSLRGRIVYVDFWASWCEPCRRSFAWMKSLHEKYGDKGLTIVAIDLDRSRDDADAFLDRNAAPFTIAFDAGGKVAERFHVAAMPSSFVIGPDGRVLHASTGFDPKKTGEVEALIATATAHLGSAAVATP